MRPYYIVDFVCFRRKIIELDGWQHAQEKQMRKDQERDNWFKRQGKHCGFGIVKY
jgi:very-short-patch-repair endonuclease